MNVRAHGIGTAAMARAGAMVAILGGFCLVFLVFQVAGAALQSGRGEAGVPVCLLVVGATVAVECAISRRGPRAALRALGIGCPAVRSILVALLISLLLFSFYPAFAAVRGVRLALIDGWPWLAVGLFAQGGVAEEMLFRGFVFRRLRLARGFRRSVAISALIFAAAHLPMFAFLSPPVALAATFLAIATALPLAHLFEQGGNTLWAPAIVHGAIQSIKLAIFPDTAAPTAALAWMGLCVVVPYAALVLYPRQRD
jgi:membrane protease YdiL (CAAX protease family)